MAIRVGINGFGRIGRNVFKIMETHDDFEVVAINDLADPVTLAHLLKYDSVFGRFQGSVSVEDHNLIVNGREIRILAEKDPAKLPWKASEVAVAIESTGVFRKRAQCAMHLEAGAQKVLLTVPPKDDVDAIIVMGVNDEDLKPEHAIISNASCTTNCLGPIAKILHDTFGIRRGLMTTIHAYTNDQRVADLVHSDLRRARAAAMNVIPTSTGAAKAIGKVIPELNGLLDGMAIRVPVPDGSVVDLVVELKQKVERQAINDAVRQAAGTEKMRNILEYCEDPIVSTDIIGNAHSCVFDSLCTMTITDNLVKVIAWYDNEWAYSHRVVDLISLAMKLG